MSDEQGDITRKQLWRLFWRVSGLSALALAFGGVAVRGYAILRFKDPKEFHLLDLPWVWALLVTAVCGAVAFATLVVAWRLMHPKRAAPSWALGMLMLAIVLFALVVWPTAWTYREYGCQIIRLNRLTGIKSDIATLPGCFPKDKDGEQNKDSAPKLGGA